MANGTTFATLVEAHSYAGGLRHTPFTDGNTRPVWVPDADTVGWHDEFGLGPDDTVIEFSQRDHNGEKVTWIAVYERSIDTRFGDRSNHAGIGVWLLNARIADASTLLISLKRLSGALAANPEPELLADKVAEFTNKGFLNSYLVAADELPRDWSGAPASASALTDTTLAVSVAPEFELALAPVAEAVTRLSLDWNSEKTTPRTLILVTSNPATDVEGGFTKLPPAGSLLADIVERIPQAFKSSSEEVRRVEMASAKALANWETERQALQDKLHEERQKAERLDGAPVSLEGIARRLNAISRQSADIKSAIEKLDVAKRVENVSPPRLPVYNTPRPSYSPVMHESGSRDDILNLSLWIGLAVVCLAVILSIVYKFS